MSDISVLGLGHMGSALARSLAGAGRQVTVWNRSSEKMRPLAKLGAACADNVAAAVAASPLVLVCVDSYQTTRAIFQSENVLDELTGRIIVQLSTGTPKEARESETWFAFQRAQYLDGAILASPEAIGSSEATILYSGRRETFEFCREILKPLADDTRYVGEDVGRAAALDLAWLIQLFATFTGVAHGTLICQAEGVDLGLYSTLLGDGSARWFLDVIKEKSFENPGATLSVWKNSALRRIQSHAREANISSEIPNSVSTILDRAEAAGFGDEHIAAIVKVLRKPIR
jgi:3-hydroxyisobutyrate dehydrogenase-like beta-hydroxyacid dehydrogenase